jgi:peptidoglycan/LPS O-acetylase OafA/YrhL
LGAILGYLLLPCYIYPQWSTVYPMNLPSWSLFFELTANFAYALGLRYLSTSRLIFLTILGAMILAIIAFFTGDVQSTGAFKTGFWLGFGRVLFPFAAGILLFRFRSPVRYAPWLGCVLPIFLAVLLLSPVGQSPVLDLLYIIVLFPSIVRLGASINVGPKLTNVFLAAGKMSYPLYITHHPLLRVFYRLEEHIHVSEPLFLVIETLACIVFAYCALRFYDEPLRAMLNSLSRRSLVREAVPRLSGMRLPLGYYPLPLRRTSRQVESKITPPTPS